MTDPTTDPAAYTDQELKQALARVIALARSEGLNDAEADRYLPTQCYSWRTGVWALEQS